MIAICHPEARLRGVPLRRVLIALCASLLAHFLIAGGWGGSGAARTMTVALAPLQARLELIPAVLPSAENPGDSLTSTTAQPAELPRRAAPPVATAVEQPPAGAAAAGPDLRFYLAHELDRYPSPLSTLSLGNDRGIAGSVRLQVSIDAAGRVVDVAVIGTDPSGALERLARDRVLAMPFAPAWRDGRPVKSRVLLVLGRDS
jgi:TonB family protein